MMIVATPSGRSEEEEEYPTKDCDPTAQTEAELPDKGRGTS